MAINGALGGLVSITAEPLTPEIWQAVLIGADGGLIVVLTVPLLDRMRIDDVVGAIPVHLLCGIWGTMIVPLSNGDSSFFGQFVGVAAIGVFVSVASAVVWIILRFTVGLRPTEQQEDEGLDKTKIGIEAYPEFGSGSQRL